MSRYTPHDMATALGGGLPSIAVSHFDDRQALDEGACRDHLAFLLSSEEFETLTGLIQARC